MSRRVVPTGFTLVEVLVVIAIIAILLGLLLPAIQKVRATAARIKCSNNLKQLGFAFHGYEETNRSVPPGSRSGAAYGSSGVGWGVFLLPYLEQQAVYSDYAFAEGWDSAGNLTRVGTVKLAMMQCPSNAGRREFDVSGRTLQVGDYTPVSFVEERFAINNGLTDAYPIWNGTPSSANRLPGTRDRVRMGVMANVNPSCTFNCDKVVVRLDDISDGTSNTILVGEDAARSEDWIRGPLKTGDNLSANASWSSRNANMSVHGASAAGTPAPTPTLETAPDPQFSCAINCTNQSEIFSFHTGGALFLFADGHVRFLSESLSPRAFAALVTRAGGEASGSD